MRSIVIIGCGYTGLRLGRAWLARGASVVGVATRAASLETIAAAGITPVAWDLDELRGDELRDDERRNDAGRDDAAPSAGSAPSVDLESSIVYYSVPPPPVGGIDTRLARCLARVRGRPRRLVYLSTTGVYGDHAGGRVDETTSPTPRTPRALRRLAAEVAIQAWADARDLSWCVLRVAGIYGPERLPLERLRRGEPAIRPEEATPTNRIHVDDLATACVAAGISDEADRRIVNVCDGSDASSTEFLLRVARIAGLPPPPFVTRAEARASFSASAWSFLGESRRVDNRRLTEQLGVALAFHDLDAGIRASL
jgi:nucleoside-diphosphate-sugar epimerase